MIQHKWNIGIKGKGFVDEVYLLNGTDVCSHDLQPHIDEDLRYFRSIDMNMYLPLVPVRNWGSGRSD